MGFAQDAAGLYVPQASLVARGPFPTIVGSITYRCHSCGDLLTRKWEVFFVDDTPGREWASELEPPAVTPRTTTHHVGHLASG